MNAHCVSRIRALQAGSIVLAAIVIAGNVSTLRAQALKISFGIGYEYGVANISFFKPDTNRHNSTFNNGVEGWRGFAEVEVPLNSTVSIETRLAWNHSHPTFIAPGRTLYLPIPGLLEPLPMAFYAQEEIDFSMQTLQLELLGRISVGDGFSIAAGPVLGYRMVEDYRHSRLYDPPIPDIRFFGPAPAWWPRNIVEHGRRGIFEEVSYQKHLNIGALLTAEYNLRLNRRWSLVPEFRLRGDFTSPFTGTGWNLFTAGGGVSLRLTF